MNNGYLIPANAKKGTLIFNIFRPFDLILFCIGVGVTLLLLAIVPSTNLVAVILALLPGMICGFLVFPFPNYHNIMCALGCFYKFYTERRKFVWKGWCFYEQFAVGSESGSKYKSRAIAETSEETKNSN